MVEQGEHVQDPSTLFEMNLNYQIMMEVKEEEIKKLKSDINKVKRSNKKWKN